MPDPLGVDLANLTDLTETFRLVSGPRAVAEALYRRWTTPQGGVWYDPEYESLDLRDYLGASHTASQRASLATLLQRIGLADDRLDELVVTLSVATDARGDTLTVSADGVTAEGPFRLVMAVSPELVTLLSVSPS